MYMFVRKEQTTEDFCPTTAYVDVLEPVNKPGFVRKVWLE